MVTVDVPSAGQRPRNEVVLDPLVCLWLSSRGLPARR